MTWKKFMQVAFTGLLLVGPAACRRAQEPQPSTPPAADAGPGSSDVAGTIPEVTVVVPTEAALEMGAEAPGTFVPYEEVTISAEAAGPVTVVSVAESSRVKQGEVLVRIDPIKAELAVKQAVATLAQARASLDKAKSELDRKNVLLADRTVPQSTYDTFKAQYDGAAAAADGADSALELARQRLADLTITAPFAGVVKEKRVTVGQYVREGESLVVVMRVDPLKLQFDVPEKYADRVATGQQVQTTVAALPGRTFTGTIRTVFPSVSVQSRTIRIEAWVPNADYRLKPGFFGSVRVPLSGVAGSMVVPRAALVRREGTESVFVLKGDQAQLVPVQTGAETADSIEIVGGLGRDERVIVSGGDTLRSGDRVKVRG